MLIERCFYLKIAENWVFKQSLQIFVLQIMQNNTSHLKYLAVAKEICWVIFLFCFFLQKGDIILRFLTIDILGICCRWLFCKLHRFDKSPYQWWIVVNNILNWFCFVLSCKMDDVMLRLLIVFFLGMFFKLVFCKLENMRWPSNNLKHLTEVLGQNG